MRRPDWNDKVVNFMSKPSWRAVRAACAVSLLIALSGCFGPEIHRAPAIHYGLNSGADSAGVHTVSSGDTLWSIAKRYKLSMSDIIYLNKLRPPYAIASGNRLRLPPPNRYEVKAGDTLYRISRTFNTNMTELARLNDISAPYRLMPGQYLRLPAIQPPQPTRVARARAASPGRNSPRPNIRPGKKPDPRLGNVPARADSRFLWPVDGPVISTYGPKTGGLHNDGINIKAPKGTPVRAAENGVVVYAGNELKGFGNLILVRHSDRWMSAYAHLDKRMVAKGGQVKQGQTIGTLGQTGSVDTPQLHFEVRRGTDALNPQLYLMRQGT